MQKLFVCLLGLCVSPVFGGSVQMNWSDPSSFRDIRPAEEPRKRYQQQVMAKLNQHFSERAKAWLPEDYQLQLTVTNLDLAGEVRFGVAGGTRELRIIKQAYSPMIALSYSLSDRSGTELHAGETQKRDMSFLDRISVGNQRNEAFHYDKALIDLWFKEDLLPLLAKQ